MNGVYENAVITALEAHKHISEIIICTDNDEGGIDAAERLTDILKEKGYTNISRKLPEFKDWNECLKAENGVEALAAVPHRRKKSIMKLCQSCGISGAVRTVLSTGFLRRSETDSIGI